MRRNEHRLGGKGLQFRAKPYTIFFIMRMKNVIFLFLILFPPFPFNSMSVVPINVIRSRNISIIALYAARYKSDGALS